MAGNAYKDIMKMVNAKAKATTTGEEFVADIERYMQISKAPYTPGLTVKPSMLGGCFRQQFFVLNGVEQDPGKLQQPSMISIQESGTDRHERIQNYCQDAAHFNLPIIWVDPVEEVAKANLKGIHTEIVRRDGNELLCYNKDYNLRFKCDGIIIYKGVKMILEIKTEEHFKFTSRVCADPKHAYQGRCYSMCFGINQVMFLYENRNYTTRKAYQVEITDSEITDVKQRITNLLDYQTKQLVPPKEKDKCVYCDYKQECKKYGMDNPPFVPKDPSKKMF